MRTINGAMLIQAERARQVHDEGWTAEHDSRYTTGELVGAAVGYASYAWVQLSDPDRAREDEAKSVPQFFPWDAQWWKPTDDEIRNLVKAGALIAAQIDQLLRERGAMLGSPIK